MPDIAPSFFVRQEAARRSTLVLSFYFVLALLCILALVDAAFGLLFYFYNRGGLPPGFIALFWHDWTLRSLIAPLLLIGMGALIGFFQMRTGGHAVARMVRATLVDFSGTDGQRRRLINVVEEMAIASGLRLPALYVMEHEGGINAFVAGYSANEAVLVVTAGALQQLDRDQLQGVIGHEFSHILNGDMRINIRLIAVLTGLLIMGQTGRVLIDMGRYTTADGKGGLLSMACFLLGCLIWPLGFIGLLSGRLIKAAISRHRESLADACSVQFTRNPEGLAGALLKISEQPTGSHLSSHYAESMSHMCFGPSLRLAQLYATHPPLEVRINAIDPLFLVRERARRHKAGLAPLANVPERMETVDQIERPFMNLTAGNAVPVRTLSASVGTVRPQDVLVAVEFRRKLPPAIARALENTAGCRALLYALLAEQQDVGHAIHQTFFRERETPELAEQVGLLRTVLAASQLVRLPLVDLALPRLGLLSRAEAQALLASLQAFSQLDHKLSVFEFALLMLLRQQLLQTRAAPGHHSLHHLAQPVSLVVAVLVRHGDLHAEHQQQAYRQALEADLQPLPPMLAEQALTLPKMALALRSLTALSGTGKQRFLEICAVVVQYDGRLSRREYELLRVVAALLECPLPLGQMLPESTPETAFT